MGKWAFALGGLLVWAAHFFLLYAFVSIFPGTELARLLSLLATIPALAADGVLLAMSAARRLKRQGEAIDGWLIDLAGLGAAASFVAVVWQALPAVIIPASA